jgi:transmembrane sensor
MKAKQGNEEELQKAERIAYLIAGHIRGTLTEAESDELDEWITQSDENLALFEKLTDEDNIEEAMAQFKEIEKGKAEAFKNIQQRIHKERGLFSVLPYIVVACVLVIAVAVYMVWIHNKKTEEPPVVRTKDPQELPAGRERAVLTLSDGRTLILDSSGRGEVAKEGGMSIEKNEEGEVVYKGTETAMRYNTISTPRGGQYQVVLGDGTKVWLNAESSLKFPAGFNGEQRNVELRGEAYFEVAKDAAHPFFVKILAPWGDGGRVEVLGTHFNIDAYGDEGVVKTTLLEGRVKMELNDSSRELSPGEQSKSRAGIEVIKTDVDEAVAWKKGKFLFRNATVHTIGEQIKRWYDVEVEYRGEVRQHFNTEADRSLSLPQLLKGLEGTNEASFILQGRKLIIEPAKVLP